MKKLLLILLLVGCGGVNPEPPAPYLTPPVASATPSASPALPVNPINNLDFLSCSGNLCQVIGAPIILQTDPNLPASDPEMVQYAKVGCYEASVVITNTAALLNRTTGVIDPNTRAYQFDNLVSGYPYMTTGTDLLIWQYEALLDSNPKWSGFYYQELLTSFGPLTDKYPDTCVSATPGSCWWGGNANGNFFGYSISDGVVLDSSIFIDRLQQKYMQIVAFQWTANTINNGLTTIEWNPIGHKIALSGFLTDGSDYPLLFNDPGSGVQTYGKIGTLHSSASLKMLAITNKGPWATNTYYVVGDTISYMGATYRALNTHTSTYIFDSTQWEAFDAPLNTWSYFEYRDDPNHTKLLLVGDYGIRLF
jgi:hypothetical protein